MLAHIRRRTGSLLAMTLAAVVLLSSSAADAEPTLTNLGVWPGGTGSQALAVSADGSVVVGNVNSPSQTRAFRWTSASGMVELQVTDGGQTVEAKAVSGDGTVIAGTLGQYKAYRWTFASGGVSIGALPGESNTNCWGTAISDDGAVIAGSAASTQGLRAFRWTSLGGMENLGTLPDGRASEAHAVSADGTAVAGVAVTDSSGLRAFRWTIGEGMASLGTLPGGSSSSAAGISANGLVVVGWGSSLESGDRAFRWTADAGMLNLGAIPPPVGPAASRAFAVSGNGSVVAGQCDGVGAFLWSSAMGMVSLSEYLQSQGVDLAGWQLTHATGLSFDGTTIVGYGTFNGQQRGWLVKLSSPPETCADLSGDGVVSFPDISAVLAYWGTGSAFGDANADGAVDFDDITAVIAQWLSEC